MNRTARLCTTVVLLAGTGLAATAAATASPSAPRSHALTFTAHTLASKTDGNRLVETDRLIKSGTTLGYSVNTCTFDFTTHRAHCVVSLGRDNGQLRAKATINVDTGAVAGRVIGGSGAYRGATGTVTGVSGSRPNTTKITVHWQS